MRFSILMPVRNGARHLHAALRSIAAQTAAADEVVVVDDASGDATFALLSAWQRRLPLKLVRGEGRGIARALNRGLQACSGDVIVRMDADDVMHPRRLEAQRAHLLAHADVDISGTEVRSFPPARVSDRRAAYDAWLSQLHTPAEHARDLYVEAPLAHPTAAIRRHAIESVGGYHVVPWPEDYDLWLRLHAAGFRMGKPFGVLHFWRERGDRLSRTSADYTREAIRRCKMHHLVRHHALAARPVVVVGAGIEGKATGRALLREGVTLLGHVDADPRKVGGLLMGEGGVRVFAPSALPGIVAGQPRPMVLVAVGTAGARPGLRAELDALGLVEGVDAVVVA